VVPFLHDHFLVSDEVDHLLQIVVESFLSYYLFLDELVVVHHLLIFILDAFELLSEFPVHVCLLAIVYL